MSNLGANARVGYGFETVAPMQKATTLYGLLFSSLTFNPDPKYSRTRNMRSRAMQLQAQLDEMRLPWSVDFDPSVDDLARLVNHIQGFSTITEVSAGAVYDWAGRDLLSTDSPSADISSMSIDADRDDGYSTLLLGSAMREMEIKVQANQIARCKISGLACHFTHQKDATMTTTGGTFTGKLHIRGNRLGTDAEDTTNHLKVKATTPGALNGTAKVKCTKGATAYGGASSEIAVTAGVWYPFTLADGTNASGDQYNPVEFMLSSGGTLSTNDEFEIQAKRPAPTLVYPSRQPLHANGLKVLIAGTEYIVDNFDVKITRPRKEWRGGGSAYPRGMRDEGLRSFAVGIKRDYVTRRLYNMMLGAEVFTFDATINGGFIATVGGVSYFEKFTLASAKAQMFKAGTDPKDEKQETEDAQIVPFYDGTNPDMTSLIRCTLATYV